MEKRRVIVKDQKWLDYLKTQRCLFTGRYGGDDESVVPMHIGTAGRGLKTDDEAIPMINWIHQKGHNGGEVSALRQHAPDDVIRAAFRALAREMYQEWLKDG